MALDTLVSQIAYRARLLERALHDPGPWYMRFEGITAPCARAFLDDGVHFHAHFLPPLADASGKVTLYLRDEPVSVFDVQASAHGFTVEWAMRGWVVDESRQR